MTTREEKNTFSAMIEERALRNGVKVIEAITDYCEEVGLEVEVAATLINPILKAKIEEEAQALRFLQRSAKLPI